MWQRVRNCLDGRSICLERAAYCPVHGGKQIKAGPIRLMLDCAEICQISTNYLLCGSELGLVDARPKSAPTWVSALPNCAGKWP